MSASAELLVITVKFRNELQSADETDMIETPPLLKSVAGCRTIPCEKYVCSFTTEHSQLARTITLFVHLLMSGGVHVW